MNKILKVLSCLACVFAFCFMAIGYAAVQDTLMVSGSITIEKQEVEITITYKDTKAYELASDTGVLTIKETYIGDDNKTYRVVGIDNNGFSSSPNELGYDALEVESVFIPKSVKTIGDNAFTGCSNLKSFTVDAGNVDFIATNQVLFDSTGTDLLRYPPCNQYSGSMLYKIPLTTTSITPYAFCDLPTNTVIVTDQDWGTASPWYGATSDFLVLEASENELYNAMQSASYDSTDGYTVSCSDAVEKPSVRFDYQTDDGNGNTIWAKTWAAIENGQFVIPASICNGSPCILQISSIVGDVTLSQLEQDLSGDNKAIIGGGNWGEWDLTFALGSAEEIIINDGIFEIPAMLVSSNLHMVINDGIFNNQFWIANDVSGCRVTLDICGGMFTDPLAFSGCSQVDITVYEGTFAFDPALYDQRQGSHISYNLTIDENSIVQNNGDGTWTVQKAASS